MSGARSVEAARWGHFAAPGLVPLTFSEIMRDIRPKHCRVCAHEFRSESLIYGYGLCAICADPTGELRRHRRQIKNMFFAANYGTYKEGES